MIQQTLCTSFKAELLQGVHDLTTDTIKLALFTSSADLGAATTAYSTTAEASGGGYAAGGETVAGVTVSTSGTTALADFDDVTWVTGGFTARGGLLYNSSKADRAIAVLDFGADKTASSPFVVTMPAATPTTALIRIE